MWKLIQIHDEEIIKITFS